MSGFGACRTLLDVSLIHFVVSLLSQLNISWAWLDVSYAKGRSDTHCKIKETLLIQELKPTLNGTVSSEKLYLY